MLTVSTYIIKLDAGGNMPKQKKYHYGDLRASLVEKASDMIEDEGIENITMRSLSKELGVSRTAAYRHYRDKTALLKAVAEDTFNSLRVYIREESADIKDPLEQFLKISHAYVGFALRNPAKYRQMFSREVVSEPRVPELGQAALNAFTVLMEVIENCCREGVFTIGDTYDLANAAWATVHGLCLLLIDGQIRTRDDGKRLHALLVNGNSKPSPNTLQIVDATIRVLAEGFRGKKTNPHPGHALNPLRQANRLFSALGTVSARQPLR